jgi:citrate lyase subunit alpha/citrate CoA-transferase
VSTVTTPGETIDAVATEAGVAVNPRRPELCRRLVAAGLAVVSIEQLRAAAAAASADAGYKPSGTGERIVAVVEYRDGTVIDIVRQILPSEDAGAPT